ncbi:MAG TPA: DNA repair protein RadA [Vicinamibacteria bacterium]|nr:DNA repair protein RadA [Vicinamibacteria bacterium]
MAKLKTAFVCQQCGMTATKWLGRCPDCEAWNSFVEEIPAAGDSAEGPSGVGRSGKALAYAEVPTDADLRIGSGLEEFDRVLGGGIVEGSLVLLGGAPGIGKSTLLLQVAAARARDGNRVVYVSGEESERQIKLRGERLGVDAASLLLFAETGLERILGELSRLDPSLVILDSVQTVYSPKFSSTPGSISQVREVTAELLYYAKSSSTPVFLIGHVNKEGNLAGPKALEHMVDTVLYFEGEQHQSHRVVRAVKNRFGAAGELGVFEMTEAGLVPVENPSALFLSERDHSAPGSAVVCSLEGTRPLLLEIQSLVAQTGLGYPRRVAVGFEVNRVSLLLAVLEKHVGMPFSAHDVYVNVAGGLSVTEPVADLGLVASVASSLRGQAIPTGTAFIGEVGLSGEVRAAQQFAVRVKEIARMGFQKTYVPNANLPLSEAPAELELIGIADVSSLMGNVF